MLTHSTTAGCPSTPEQSYLLHGDLLREWLGEPELEKAEARCEGGLSHRLGGALALLHWITPNERVQVDLYLHALKTQRHKVTFYHTPVLR
jgi:hypothetical protein